MNSPKKKESPFLNLFVNIVIPVLVMTQLNDEKYLGPVWALIVGLAFPLGYGLYEFIGQKKVNFISILSFVSVFLTGILGVFEFPTEWIAIKEAGVPLIIALAIIISAKTRFPLVKKLLYNDAILHTENIEAALKQHNTENAFEKLMVSASYWLSISFFLSAILNYVLAKVILVSEPGTAAFTEELGKMQGLSFPVIALPSMLVMMFVLWLMVKKLQELTKLPLNDLFQADLEDKKKS